MDNPDTGSAFDAGHRPRAAFFLAHPPCSPLVVGVSTLVCGFEEGAVELEVADEDDVVVGDIDEDELVR